MPAVSLRARVPLAWALAVAVAVAGAWASVAFRGLGGDGAPRTSVWDGVQRMLAPTRWSDFGAFFADGDLIVAGRWPQAYGRGDNAAGPVQCVADRVLAEWARVAGGWIVPAVFVVAMQALLVAWCAWMLAGRLSLRPAALAWWVPGVAALVFLISGMPVAVYASGHWWQVAVFAGWLGAGVLLARGHWLVAGAVLAFATGVEPWALLVVPALGVWAWRGCGDGALRHRGVRAGGFATVAVAGGVLAWLPFLPALARAPFAWGVVSSSVWGLLGFEEAGSAMRLAQAALVVAGSMALAWWAGRARSGLPVAWGAWLVTLATGCLRVASDAWFVDYYWAGLAALLVAGAVAAGSVRAPGWWLLVAGTLASWPFWVPWLAEPIPGAGDLGMWMALPVLALAALFTRRQVGTVG